MKKISLEEVTRLSRWHKVDNVSLRTVGGLNMITSRNWQYQL